MQQQPVATGRRTSHRAGCSGHVHAASADVGSSCRHAEPARLCRKGTDRRTSPASACTSIQHVVSRPQPTCRTAHEPPAAKAKQGSSALNPMSASCALRPTHTAPNPSQPTPTVILRRHAERHGAPVLCAAHKQAQSVGMVVCSLVSGRLVSF